MRKKQIIPKDQIIFNDKDVRLVRHNIPCSDDKPMVVYHLYIREDSEMHKTYTDAAKELGYIYMDTDEHDGTYMPGPNYDHYFKLI